MEERKCVFLVFKPVTFQSHHSYVIQSFNSRFDANTVWSSQQFFVEKEIVCSCTREFANSAHRKDNRRSQLS